MSEPTRYPPHSESDRSVFTTACNYCVVGCGYQAYLWNPKNGSTIPTEDVPHMSPSWIARVRRSGEVQVAAVVPDPKCPVNRGNHSIRGGTMGRTLTRQHDNAVAEAPATRERLTTPMIRVSEHEWEAMDWDETLKLLADLIHEATDGFKQSRRVGAKLYGYHSLENTFAASTLFKQVIGTPNVAEHDRPSVTDSSPGLTDATIHHHAFSYDDLLDCDVVFLLGSNAYECQSVLFQQSIAGRQLVVLDPRRTITADYAVRTGGIHLQPQVLGADCRIIQAISRLIIEEHYEKHNGKPELQALRKLVSEDRVEDGKKKYKEPDKKNLRAAHRIRSFEAWENELLQNQDFEPTKVANVTGVPLDQLRAAAKILANPNLRTAILYEKGLIWGYNYANTAAVANLAVLTFNFNVPNRPNLDPPYKLQGQDEEPFRDLKRKRGFCGRLGGHQKGSAEPRKKGKKDNHPDAESTDRFVSADEEGLAFGIPNYQDYHLAGSVAYGPNPFGPWIEFKHQEAQESMEYPEDITLFWVVGCNPAGDMPNAERIWKRICERLTVGRPEKVFTKEDAKKNLRKRVRSQSPEGLRGLVIVQQDVYPNYTTTFTDVLLPATGFGEDPFTRYNGERRLRLYERFQDPPAFRDASGNRDPRCKPDWWIFSSVAQQLAKQSANRTANGFDQYRKQKVPTWNCAEEIFEALANKGASNRSEWLKGLREAREKTGQSYYDILRRLGTTGVQLPVKENMTGTRTLYHHGKYGPFFVDCRWQDVSNHFTALNNTNEKNDHEYIWLINGRVNEAWNSMYSNIRNEYILQRYPDNLPGTILEVNPEWAKSNSLENGDVVEVQGRNQGRFFGVIVCQESVPKEWGFALFSYPCNQTNDSSVAREFFGHGYANNVIDGFVDPTGPISANKYARAKIIPTSQPRVALPTGAQRNQALEGDPYDHNRDRWMAREILVSRGLPRVHILHRNPKGQVVMPGATHGVFWRTTHDSRDSFVNVPLMGQFPLVHQKEDGTFDVGQSILVQMLEGKGPLPQMPLRAAPLPQRFIKRIRQWIDKGCSPNEFPDIQAILDYGMRIHLRWFGPDSEPAEVLLLDPDRGVDLLHTRARIFLELTRQRSGGSRMCWRDRSGRVLSDWTEREYEILHRYLNLSPGASTLVFDDVRRILRNSVKGSDVKALHGDFWERLDHKDFLSHKVMFAGGEIPIIRRFDGANSALVQALRGTGPFKKFRMPFMRRYISEVDIVQIEKWIDDGCPE